jgi:hypothetical protein
LRAAPTAFCASATVPSGTLPSCSSVAGLMTVIVVSPDASTYLPSMNSL